MRTLTKQKFSDYIVKEPSGLSTTWPTRPLARSHRNNLREKGIIAEIYHREWEQYGIPFIRSVKKVH
jgi:hypothetical protein